MTKADFYKLQNIKDLKAHVAYLEETLENEKDAECQELLRADIKDAKAELFELTDL